MQTWATYTRDADGQRVKRTDASGTTIYVGAHFEVQVTAGISTSYYAFGGQRVAMRTGSSAYWIHGDHPLRCAAGTVGLGSASLVTSITGFVFSDVRYYP